MTWQTDLLFFDRWARADPGWVRVPSLFRLFYDGEGGIEISEAAAFEMIQRWANPA